jgi:RNA exonuclease 1
VFYETEPSNLHSRHPFSHSRPPSTEDTAFDVVALDCEMIYTTSGMSVARVSVVDGAGREVFDQFIKMAENVEVMWVPVLRFMPFRL